MKWIACLTVAMGFVLIHSPGADAHEGCCQKCGCQCGEARLVAKTIMVPCVITETRLKSCVIEKEVEREETYTEFKRVPVKRKFVKETCYLEDEVKTKTITQKECHRVQIPVTRTYAVNVPVTEVREGVRQREVCTHCGKVCIEEPCTCQITRMEKGLRSTNLCEEQVVFDITKKDIDYCVKTPKKKTEFCAEETAYTLEPVEKKRKVTVCVPEIVKKPYDVQVTKMVPKTIYCCEKCCHGVGQK